MVIVKKFQGSTINAALYRKRGKVHWAKHSPCEVFRGSTQFCGALTSSAYYFTIAKFSQENFHDTLKNRERLAIKFSMFTV